MKEEFYATLDRLREDPFQCPLEQDPNLLADVYCTANFAKWCHLVFSVGDKSVYVDAVVDMCSNYSL